MSLAAWAKKLLRPPPPDEHTALADRAMRAYIEANPLDDFARRSHPYDVRRLARSLDWLAALDPPLTGLDTLELGGHGIASAVIEERFPSIRLTCPGFDLREPFPLADASFDVALCMEVIEHVADLEYGHATVLSGVQHCLGECARVLRVGGRLFLTTPNATSTLVLQRTLEHQPPWQYPFHFREFTLEELVILVEHAGLHVVRTATEYVWSAPSEFARLHELMKSGGFSLANRGDDTFLLAERRATAPSPRGRLALPVG